MTSPSRVARLLHDAAFGRFPPADGEVDVVADSVGPAMAVLGFVAHFLVCAPVDPGWVRDRLPPGDLSAPLGAVFVAELADKLDAHVGANDAVFATVADGTRALSLAPTDELSHDRVARAHSYRTDVRAWTTVDGAGLLVLGRGVAGRWEASFEVAEGARGHGLGRALAAAARGLLPAGTPVFAQVAPGNVASMRAVIGAGYRPVGGEVLLTDAAAGRP